MPSRKIRAKSLTKRCWYSLVHQFQAYAENSWKLENNYLMLPFYYCLIVAAYSIQNLLTYNH